jgi:hypothetical protein
MAPSLPYCRPKGAEINDLLCCRCKVIMNVVSQAACGKRETGRAEVAVR